MCVCVRARVRDGGGRVQSIGFKTLGFGSREQASWGQEARKKCRMLEKLLASIKDTHAPHRPGPFCPEVRDRDGTRGLFYDTPS